MLSLRVLGLLTLIFLLCDADSTCPAELNPLTLDPPQVIGQEGETVQVNCTSSNEDHEGMYWRQTGNGKPDLDMEDEKSFIVGLISLSDWNVTAACKIMLNKSCECSKDLEITVYKNPEMVIMYSTKYDKAVEGSQYELQCDVLNVAPVQNLIVRWYKDNQTVKTESFTNGTKAVTHVSSTLTVNISRGDNGAQFRCEAQLDFGPHGAQPPNISNIHHVSVHYAPELENRTDVVYVDEGGNVTLSCEAKGNPPPIFHWTTDGVNFTEDTNNLTIFAVHTKATFNCTATNYLGKVTKQTHVVVMKTTMTTALAAMTTPEASAVNACPLILTPDEIVVRFGDPASVNCSTTATDALGMGWEATEGGTGFNKRLAVTWTIERLEDWTIQPQCYITPIHGSQCTVTPVITLYKTPDSVSVSVNQSGPMTEGTEYMLYCNVLNVAPVQKLKVKWYRGNETVKTDTFNDTHAAPLDMVSSLRVTPQKGDNAVPFKCEAELHLGPKGPERIPTTTSKPYIANVLYKPLISCPGQHAGVENQFSVDMVHCHTDGNPPPTVQWHYQGKPINGSEPLNRTHSGKYTAEAANHLGRSNASVDITIEYSPSFTCNERYEVEGCSELQCKAEGIPKPTITWFKDEKKVASLKCWTKDNSGVYSIQATNKHGTTNHIINLDVLYAPVFKEGNSNLEVTLGENVTLDCLAEGNPPPVIVWKHISAVNKKVTQESQAKITGATSTDAGVYNCVASNKVGSVTRSVTLVIKGETFGIQTFWWLLIVLVIIIIALIGIVLHSRRKKHGQYNFVPDTAKESSDIPLTTQSNGVQA